jgi:hypothetical protein
MKYVFEGIAWFVAVIFVWSMGYLTGIDTGEHRGMEKQKELEREIQCEVKYEHEIQQNISGECLKYFLE